MAMLSNQDLIRRVPLFGNLTATQAQSLAVAVTKRRYKKGQPIVEQGHNSKALFVILAGKAFVVMNDSKGREVILATLKTTDYIGEMSLIDNEAHSASVIAETQVDALVLGRDDFNRCMAENSAIAASVMRGLVKRLRAADQKIISLALLGVYGRVANILLDSAEKAPSGELLISEKISRQQLAKMVGASREMVSRVMKDFEEQGFIKTLDGGALRVYERRTLPR